MDVILKLLKKEASKILNTDPSKIPDTFAANKRIQGYYESDDGFWYRFSPDGKFESGEGIGPPSLIGAYMVADDDIVMLAFRTSNLYDKFVKSYRFVLAPDRIKLTNLRDEHVSVFKSLIDDMGTDSVTADLFEQLNSMWGSSNEHQTDTDPNLTSVSEQSDKPTTNEKALLNDKRNKIPVGDNINIASKSIYDIIMDTDTDWNTVSGIEEPNETSIDTEYINRLNSTASRLASALGITLPEKIATPSTDQRTLLGKIDATLIITQKNKYCPQCGKLLLAATRFCTGCGKDFAQIELVFD